MVIVERVLSGQINKGVVADLVKKGVQAVGLSGRDAGLVTAEPLAGPNDIWRSAVVDALTGNYDLAIGGYKEFLSKYPNDPRAAEAQLSIADALFSQKKYEQALTDYDLFLQKYPGHDKSSAALLKKGLALAEQNQPQLAIAALQQVVKEFPKTSAAEAAQSKIRELQPGQRRPR